MLICICMVKAEICLHVKFGHGMRLIVSPMAYIDSRKSKRPIPQLVSKPILHKSMNVHFEAENQLHTLRVSPSASVVNTAEHAPIQITVESSANVVTPMMNQLSGNVLAAVNARIRVMMLTLTSQESVE